MVNIIYDCDKLTEGSLHRAIVISSAMGAMGDAKQFPTLQMVLILEKSRQNSTDLKKQLAEYERFVDAEPDEPPERIVVGAPVLFKSPTSGELSRCYIEGEGDSGRHWKLRGLDDGKARMVAKEEVSTTMYKIPEWAAAYPATAINACMDYGNDHVARRKLEDIINGLIWSGTTISVEFLRADRTSARGVMHHVKIHVHESTNEIIYPDRLLNDRRLLNT